MKLHGRSAEVVPYIKASVEKNAASPEMLADLKADYLKHGGKEAGFDEYVNSLKADEAKEKHVRRCWPSWWTCR